MTAIPENGNTNLSVTANTPVLVNQELTLQITIYNTHSDSDTVSDLSITVTGSDVINSDLGSYSRATIAGNNGMYTWSIPTPIFGPGEFVYTVSATSSLLK